MPSMADPMSVLNSLQHAISSELSTDQNRIDEEKYLHQCDEPSGGKRHIFAKIVDGEVRSISIFGAEEPFKGIPRWSVGYAVNEKQRGKRLAEEAVKKGLSELKKEFVQNGVKGFYLEALVARDNTSSIRVAERLFSQSGLVTTDHCSGTPSLLFYRFIELT